MCRKDWSRSERRLRASSSKFGLEEVLAFWCDTVEGLLPAFRLTEDGVPTGMLDNGGAWAVTETDGCAEDDAGDRGEEVLLLRLNRSATLSLKLIRGGGSEAPLILGHCWTYDVATSRGMRPTDLLQNALSGRRLSRVEEHVCNAHPPITEGCTAFRAKQIGSSVSGSAGMFGHVISRLIAPADSCVIDCYKYSRHRFTFIFVKCKPSGSPVTLRGEILPG